MSAAKDFLKVVPLIERLSLIRFANESGIKRLEEAIEFANQIKECQTEGVQPMISPNETDCTYLRDDISTETNREDITRNASRMIEDYFVVPIGNTSTNDNKPLNNDNEVKACNQSDL